jgi:hypothetical protein
MDLFAEHAREAMKIGLNEMALLSACTFIEVLLSDLARENGLKATQTSIMQIDRELVSRGVISPCLMR